MPLSSFKSDLKDGKSDALSTVIRGIQTPATDNLSMNKSDGSPWQAASLHSALHAPLQTPCLVSLPALSITKMKNAWDGDFMVIASEQIRRVRYHQELGRVNGMLTWLTTWALF